MDFIVSVENFILNEENRTNEYRNEIIKKFSKIYNFPTIEINGRRFFDFKGIKDCSKYLKGLSCQDDDSFNMEKSKFLDLLSLNSLESFIENLYIITMKRFISIESETHCILKNPINVEYLSIYLPFFTFDYEYDDGMDINQYGLIYNYLDAFPGKIASIRCLKHLKITSDGSPENKFSFPESIFTRNLETLILDNSFFGYIPPEIREMQRLQTFELSNTHISNNIDDLVIDFCELNSLRRLKFENVVFNTLNFYSISCLFNKNLEEIELINTKAIGRLSSLTLNNLRKFVIKEMKIYISDEFIESVEKMKNLNHLSITFCKISEDNVAKLQNIIESRNGIFIYEK